jgi:hypothetical protein
MNRIFLTFLALITLHTAVTAQFKDANAQVREAKNFHGIRVGSAFDVFISQGSDEAVAVSSSDPKTLENIVVEVSNGILHIGFAKGFRMNMGNKKLKAYISFKQLDELDISGACDVKVEGSIKTDNLRLGLSGASDMKGKLEVGKLSVNLSGASDLDLTGVATSLDLDASGASKFKGFGLSSDYCKAEASGASDIRIRVNKELSVRASGASDIDYKGAGVIRDVKTSGASSVSKTGS